MKPTAEIVIYESGEARVAVRLERENLWLSLQQLAELFGRDKSVISRHPRGIFASGELEREATVAKNATVQREGGREVVRDIEYYNLDAIILVGYRAKSLQGTRFRQWATKVLREHLTRGFSLDRQRFEQNAVVGAGSEPAPTYNYAASQPAPTGNRAIAPDGTGNPGAMNRRRSIRLKGYDYTQAGAYFVTICTQGRACLFGEVVNGEMRLNEWGEIVREEWFRSAQIRQEIQLNLDEFVVMPNHIHGIVWFVCDGISVGVHGRAPLPVQRILRSLASFIAGFKSAVTKQINEQCSTPGMPVWHAPLLRTHHPQ